MGFPRQIIFRQPKAYGQSDTWTGISGVANRAIFIPFVIWARQSFTELTWRTGTTTSGNYDVGIYNSSLQALYRKGSTVMPAGSSQKVENVSLTLAPGLYYFAITLSISGINAQLRVSTNIAPANGNMMLDGALPLPADASAAVAIANGLSTGSFVGLPCFALS